MATANSRKAPDATVNSLGDVTESKVLAVVDGVPDMQPLKDLPDDYAVVAERNPTAKGFTEVGGMIALHF